MEVKDRLFSSLALFICVLLVWICIYIIYAFTNPAELPFSIGLAVSFIFGLFGFWRPSVVPKKVSRVVLILAGLYLLPGLLMNVVYLSSEANTYLCGEITMGGRSSNPDPENCHSRIKEPWVWSSAAAHFLFWPVMIFNM